MSHMAEFKDAPFFSGLLDIQELCEKLFGPPVVRAIQLQPAPTPIPSVELEESWIDTAIRERLRKGNGATFREILAWAWRPDSCWRWTPAYQVQAALRRVAYWDRHARLWFSE